MPNIVPPEGPITSPIAFIGEAPGSMESQLRRPFVGPSGQLFDKLLHVAGLLRSEVYITNVVKEQPPDNDISKFLKFSSTGKPTTTPEYGQYEQQLYRELSTLSAQVLVPMGATALFALTRSRNITKLRGSILASTTLAQVRKVIPTFHPAYALREWEYSYVIAADMQRVREESAFPELVLPERTLLIAPTYEEALQYLTLCNTQRILAVDIETVNNQVHCISLAITSNHCMSIPFMDEQGLDYFNPEQESSIWRLLTAILESPQTVKVFHNALFDVPFLLARYGIRTWPLEDTMIGQGLLAPDLRKGLDFITSLYTKEPYYKEDGKKYIKRGVGRLDDFWRYNAKDSCVTLECLSEIKTALLKQGNMEAYNRRIAAHQPILYMQQHGIRTTPDAMTASAKASGAEVDALLLELRTLTGISDFNPGSYPQMIKYFYETKGIKPYISRKTKRPTCDDTALSRLRNKGSREAELILTIRSKTKFSSTYLKVKLDEDNRLRTRFGFRTKTGRLSSAQTEDRTGGNLQNQPTAFKRYLMADVGYALYEKDLSQAENRIVAYCGPVPSMITAFENARDMHLSTGALLEGISYKEALEGYKAEAVAKVEGRFHRLRAKGKQANHALNYAMGYRKAALEWGVPEAEAKITCARYHVIYPEVQQRYQGDIQRQLKANRTITNPLGTKRKFITAWGDDLFRDAYSHFAQSTVGDKINRDGLVFIYNNQELFYAVELLSQVHDSIIFQIPLSQPWDYHAKCLLEVEQSLSSPITYGNYTFSIPSDTKMGLNLADKVKVFGSTIDTLAANLEECYSKLC